MAYAPRPSVPMSSHARVSDFLVSSLRGKGPTRYREAVEAFYTSLSLTQVALDHLDEEELDWSLADYLVELYESNNKGAAGLGLAGTTVAALSKMNPRHHYKASWKVLDIWRQANPPKQAPAFTARVVYAMVAWLVMAEQPHIGCAVLLCFVGLLRASEALSLRVSDVVFAGRYVVLCLHRTKRGLEDKVTLEGQNVCIWLKQYFLRHCSGASADDWFVGTSYNTMQRWLRKAAAALGLGHVGWSTHSLRRGGATAMYMAHMPLREIMLYGRWLAERSCREYLRKGEVAVLALEATLTDAQRKDISKFETLCTEVWSNDLSG
jgi:integrase